MTLKTLETHAHPCFLLSLHIAALQRQLRHSRRPHHASSSRATHAKELCCCLLLLPPLLLPRVALLLAETSKQAVFMTL
jgi:hypothetical protein